MSKCLLTMERDQILLCFDARFLLDHVRIAKKVPTRSVKMIANTIPTMAPELKDDVEFCDKGASEDFGGDKVDDEEASDIEDGRVEVGGVDIRDGEELTSLVVTVIVVAFDEMLLRLLD